MPAGLCLIYFQYRRALTAECMTMHAVVGGCSGSSSSLASFLSADVAAQLELSSEEGTLFWIRYMRFLRRTGQLAASRRLFLRARKWPLCGWQVRTYLHLRSFVVHPHWLMCSSRHCSSILHKAICPLCRPMQTFIPLVREKLLCTRFLHNHLRVWWADSGAVCSHGMADRAQ